MRNTVEVTEENELDLVQGLLAAADFKNDESLQKEIQIRRKGRIYFSFKIRPLSEEEYLTARQNAVVKMANPNNPQLPPVEKEVKVEELSAWKIYYATVNRDTVWKNPEVIRTLEKRGCPIITVVDVINAVLMAGEKDTVDIQIDVISGYYGDRESLEDYAKN